MIGSFFLINLVTAVLCDTIGESISIQLPRGFSDNNMKSTENTSGGGKGELTGIEAGTEENLKERKDHPENPVGLEGLASSAGIKEKVYFGCGILPVFAHLSIVAKAAKFYAPRGLFPFSSTRYNRGKY